MIIAIGANLFIIGEEASINACNEFLSLCSAIFSVYNNEL